MGPFSSSSIAWMAIAGTITCCTAIYLASIWRGSVYKASRKPTKGVRRTLSALSRSGRYGRLKRFEAIARGVVSDVESALEPPLCHRHARSFLPILADVRRHGQALLRQQTKAHRVALPDRERHLAELVRQLFHLESKLKALPKPTVTIEEVLSGKFE